MKTLSKLLVVLTLVSAMFGCKKDKPIEKQKEGKPAEVSTNIETPKVGEAVTFTADVDESKLDMIRWFFGENDYEDGKTVTKTFTQEGEVTVKLVIRYKGENKTHETIKTFTVSKVDNGGDEGDDNPDDPNNNEPPAGTIIYHSSDIHQDSLWKAKYVHVVTKEIKIIEGKLTIQAGAVVKFKDEAGITIESGVDYRTAALYAKGTQDSVITFIPEAENPTAGIWRGIVLGDGGKNKLTMEYCKVSYAGIMPGESENAAVLIKRGEGVVFNNNTIEHSANYGVSYDYEEAVDAKFFHHNTFSNNNNSSLKLNPYSIYSLGEGNVFEADKGVELGYLSDELTQEVHLKDLGVKYVVDYIIQVQKSKFKIDEGITISFKRPMRFQVAKEGILEAIGTAQKPIKFIYEPKEGVDPGSYFLEFEEDVNQSVMEYCIIDGAGKTEENHSESEAAVTLRKGSKLSFNNNTITKSLDYGMRVYQGFESFSNNKIENSVGTSMKISAKFVHTIGENNDIANDGLGIETGGDLKEKGKYTWEKQSCPYTMTYSTTIASEEGSTLELKPGVTLLFAKNTQLTVGHSKKKGTLIAKGTADNKIIFKSAKQGDDERWYGISFNKNTTAESILEYCNIEFTQSIWGNKGGAIMCWTQDAGVPTIKNCHISNTKYNGIVKATGSEPTLDGNTFENIGGEDIYQMK